eukprot:s3326_g4.t1
MDQHLWFAALCLAGQGLMVRFVLVAECPGRAPPLIKIERDEAPPDLCRERQPRDLGEFGGGAVAVVGHTLRLVVCRDEKGAHRSSATFAGVPRVQENIASVRDACQARLKVVKRLVDDPDQTLPQVSCFLRHVPVCVFLLWSQTRRVVQETVDTLRPTRKAAAKKRPAARCSGGSNTNNQDNNNKASVSGSVACLCSLVVQAGVVQIRLGE